MFQWLFEIFIYYLYLDLDLNNLKNKCLSMKKISFLKKERKMF